MAYDLTKFLPLILQASLSESWFESSHHPAYLPKKITAICFSSAMICLNILAIDSSTASHRVAFWSAADAGNAFRLLIATLLMGINFS